MLTLRRISPLLVAAILFAGFSSPLLASQDTPLEAFEGFRDAMADGKYTEAYAYLTEDSQKMILGSLIFSANAFGRTIEGDSLKNLNAKYGLDARNLDPASLLTAKNPQVALGEIGANIKVPATAFKDYMEWVSKNVPQFKAQTFGQIKQTKLSNLEIKGITARGTLTVKFEEKTKEQPAVFKNIDGKWYYDILAATKR